MATVKHHKVVAALPAQLEANAIYYVRAGAGFDVYVTNASGTLVAYPANYARTDDARLADAREWTATTVTQAEAEQGTATTRRAWTAQRVFQAIAAWWAASAMKTKLDGIATGATANATDAQLRDRATHTGAQAISTVSGLQTALDGKINTTERGVSGGIPTLDQFARIPASQLPSYVDDVLEFATTAQFPATGEGGKIYIAINQGTAANPTRQYRWTGSVYAEINPSPGTTDALAEGSTNLYFSEHRVRNTVLTGLSLAVSTAVTAADSVLSAFGKIQAQLGLKAPLASPAFTGNPTAPTPDATDNDTSIATTAFVRSVMALFGLGANGPGLATTANFQTPGEYSGELSIDGLPAGVGGRAIQKFIGSSTYGVQLLLDANDTDPSAPDLFLARNWRGGVPIGDFKRFWHTGNFDPATKADLASPTFTGDPKAPTPAADDKDTSIATTAFVRAAMGLFGLTDPATRQAWHTGNFDPATKQDKSALVTTATSRTLALTDAWNYVRPGTTSAITLTVPTNASVAFEIGTEITIRASGNITLAAASGVTLLAPAGGSLNMTARMTVTLKKVGADVWDVIGQTVAA